ncbi:uncharacterized protein LOC116303598 [Actinia tenebrosa]|uniref:Uncharacterized protein LOC116303598 n=1 Tax=Actinia tenebrosa TaxID=6105 RepID=A0A6P8IQ54_ACTTE|nr:uncharacterized protein LOC116303598 [Actinia tenebrosa]
MFLSRKRTIQLILLLAMALIAAHFIFFNYKTKDKVMKTLVSQARVKCSFKKKTSLLNTNSINPTKNKAFSCGTWQQRYAQFHRNALKSPETARFLVYTCLDNNCGGLGNRIFGIASLLYLAVLTNRVFLIHWEGATKLIDCLQPRKIEWDYPINLLKIGNKSKYHYWGSSRPNYSKKYTDIRVESAIKFKQWVSNTNFSATLTLQYELIGTIRYFGDQVLNNKYLKLKAMNLDLPKKDSNFPFATLGCAYDFLFKPTKNLSSLIQKYRKRLMPGNRVSKPRKAICMHIRTSDFQFGVRNIRSIRTTQFKNFFSCAEKVEKYIYESNLLDLAPNEEIKWFLATDNVDVKNYAKMTYKEKLFTVDFKPEHLEYSKRKDTLRMILVDMALLTECEFFLATIHSSFSNVITGRKRHSIDTFVYGEECDGTRLAKKLSSIS